MNLRNPKTWDIESFIDCELEISEGKWVQHTTKPNGDTHEKYKALKNGEYGEVEIVDPPKPLVPSSVGPLQIRMALRELGLKEEIETYIQSAPEEVVEAWEYASSFRRDSEFIEAVRVELNKTHEDVDNLFKLAATK